MTGQRERRFKQSIYFRLDMIAELQAEATRLDRPVIWIVQRCIQVALDDVKALPAVDEEPHG